MARSEDRADTAEAALRREVDEAVAWHEHRRRRSDRRILQHARDQHDR